jgi:hypothetical protein
LRQTLIEVSSLLNSGQQGGGRSEIADFFPAYFGYGKGF